MGAVKIFDAYEYVNRLQQQYGFQDIAYSLGLDGLSLTITLTPAQIGMFNSKANETDAIIFRAEAYVCMHGMAIRATLPQTSIFSYSDQLEIAGSPNVIELILFQLFSAE